MMMDDALRLAWQRHVAARQRFQELAVQAVPRPKLMEQAKRLGLQVDREMGQVSDAELAFAFDLAIYSAPPGRSRAIDRIVRQHARLQGEAVLVLNALCASWFSVFRVLRSHPNGGFILEDALLGGEVWVVDEGLGEYADIGSVVGTRLGRVSGYAITCGVACALDDVILTSILATAERSGVAPGDLAGEPRFIEGIWRRALGF
jgi:hypothetical protein